MLYSAILRIKLIAPELGSKNPVKEWLSISEIHNDIRHNKTKKMKSQQKISFTALSPRDSLLLLRYIRLPHLDRYFHRICFIYVYSFKAKRILYHSLMLEIQRKITTEKLSFFDLDLNKVI